MGMTNDDYLFFKNTFSNAGALDRIVSFINTTEDPSVERILIPDMALCAAEYFAVQKNEKVLVLLTDMTNYADALAIVSNRMDQIPSKDSMPGSLYSDLAKIYEKAVQFPAGGSITIIAVTTLSGGDITHAVPDNTGYITEGQLYLRRDSDVGKVIVDPFRSSVPSETVGDREEDTRGPPAGDECRRPPVCRCRQREDEDGERFRPDGLRQPYALLLQRIIQKSYWLSMSISIRPKCSMWHGTCSVNISNLPK